jgi:hypothetical protein
MRLQELAVLSPQARDKMEALQKAGKSGAEVFDTFKASLSGFSGAMVAQAGTWEGVVSTLTDTFNMLVANALKPYFEAVRDLGHELNETLDTMSTSFDGVATSTADTKQAFVDLIGSGLAGMIKGVSFLMVEFNAAQVVFKDVIQIIDGIRLAFLLARQAMSLGLLPGQVDLTAFKVLDEQIAKLEVTMLQRGKTIQADKAAQKEWVAWGQQMVASVDAVTGRVGAASVAVAVHRDVTTTTTEGVKKLTAAQKAAASAWTEYGSVAGGVTAQLSGATIEAIKWELAHEISQGRLAKVYQVTAEQVAAVADILKTETDAAKASAKAKVDAAKVLEEIHNKLEAGTLELNEAMKKVNSTELASIQRTLDLTRVLERMHEVERVIPPGFYQIGVALDTLGNKSTEIDDLKVKLAKADAATKLFQQSVRGLSTNFTQMAQIAGDAWGGPLRAIGQVVQAVDMVSTGLEGVGTAMQSIEKDGFNAANVAALAAGWVGVATAILSLYVSLKKAADEARRLREIEEFGNRTRDSFQSATRYSNQLSDALVATALEVNRIGSDSAVFDAWVRLVANLNTELATTPEEIARVQDAVQHGGQYIAEALHLRDIVRELGGAAILTAEQMAVVGERTRLLFGLIALGGPMGQQALHALDDALMEFANAATATGGLVGQFFLDMVQQAQDAGVELEGVAKFIAGQLSDAASGLNDLLGGLQKSATAQAQKTAQAGIDALKVQIEKSSGSARTALEKQLADAETAQKQIVGTFVVTEAQGAGLAAAVLGDFAAMVEGGTGFREALKTLQPAIDSLSAALAASGVDGGAAFGVLTDMSRVAQDAVTGPLVDALSGADRALKGLHNSGILNQDMFSGIATTAVDAYNKMIAGGASVASANMFIAPTLQDLWALQKDFGYAVDDTTQALINQAVEDGRVGDKHRPIAEQMLLATQGIQLAVEGLAKVFGVVLPKSAEDGAKGIEKALKGIKIPPIKINTELIPPEGGWPDGSTVPNDIPGSEGPITPAGVRSVSAARILPFSPTASRTAAAPTTVVIKTYLDGRQVAEAVVPQLVGAADRLGLRR